MKNKVIEALERKEVFATTGPRMQVRMFAGWDFEQNILAEDNWVSKAYATGVPMGGDLPPNAKAKAPIYDIVNFKNDIPKELTSLKLSKAKDLQNPVNNDSLFNNKIWLWLIMLVIIALLAYSSFGMLKKK